MRDCANTRRHLILGGNVKRITKAALGGLAGCGLILGATQTATGLSPIRYITDVVGDVVDLPAPGPFDDASADLRLKVTPDATNFKLTLTGIDPSAAGQVFGAHLHTLACDELDPSTGMPGGPHYNHEIVALGVPKADAEISPQTEVWFDFVPNAHGSATDDATVPFLPVDPDGVMSIVVHLLPTNPDTGLAGGRQACFPLDVSGWAPTAP
jgi:hypothetical protein